MKNRKNKKGFTIVELVIVIGVIGILSAILIPTFSSLVKQAQDTKAKADLANAYSMYAADAADGYVGEPSSTGTKLVFKGQEDVVLAPAKHSGTKLSKYHTFTVADGWNPQETTTELTIGESNGNYQLTVDQQYGEYYVYYKVVNA